MPMAPHSSRPIRGGIRRWLTTLVAFSALAFQPLWSQDKPAEIRIGVASTGTGGRPVSGGSYAALAAEWRSLENEFAKDGIKVKYTYFQGAGPSVNECLANRQIDFAFQGDLAAMAAKAGGLATRLIMATDRFGAIFIAVPAESPVRRFEDLKGKRIALFKGTNLQMAFWNLMVAKGFKESDFKLINMSLVEGDAALLARDVDAQVSYNDVVPLVETGQARIIYSTHADLKLGRLSHLLVLQEFAHRWPAIVQRVVNTLLKAAAWQAEEKNRAKAYQIWAKSGFGVSAWKYEFDDYALKDRGSPLFDPFYRAQYKRLLKIAREQKLVRKEFDVDAWLDGSYVERGIRTLKLERVWRELDAEGQPN
jgi:sulfonate transport system substrate-binding protein